MTASSQFPFETIVVASDFSTKPSCAFRYAQAIAHWYGAKLALAHVADPIGDVFANETPGLPVTDQTATDEWNRTKERLRARGMPIQFAARAGEICELILQAMHDYGGDLLVLGTEDTTQAGRAALGARARDLLARTGRPILTVTPDAEPRMQWAGRWRTVLLATDFSSCSLAALTAAHRIAHEQLMVLHALKPEKESEQRGCLERLRFLAPMNESHTVPVEHIVTAGEPCGAIVELARKHRPDLIVLGGPPTILPRETLHSSTVLQVISQVFCPVLCIPAARQEKKPVSSLMVGPAIGASGATPGSRIAVQASGRESAA